MKFTDLFYFSFQNFKNRKSRVFFTILGVAVAIAVVLSMVAFGYGLQANLLKQITTAEALQRKSLPRANECHTQRAENP